MATPSRASQPPPLSEQQQQILATALSAFAWGQAVLPQFPAGTKLAGFWLGVAWELSNGAVVQSRSPIFEIPICAASRAATSDAEPQGEGGDALRGANGMADPQVVNYREQEKAKLRVWSLRVSKEIQAEHDEWLWNFLTGHQDG